MKYSVLFGLFLSILTACSVSYSTISGTAPTEATHVYIPLVYNQIGAGPPDISQTYTELLREYFQRNTKLEISKVEVPGQLKLEGYISGYRVTPISPSINANGQEQAAQNRLTMTVKFKYTNPFDKNTDFDQSFSYFKDYDGDKSLSDVEEELTAEIYEQLVILVFNKSFDNW